jgi:cellulose synthase (UDP-forming)
VSDLRQSPGRPSPGMVSACAAAPAIEAATHRAPEIRFAPERPLQEKLKTAIARIVIVLAVVFSIRYFYWRAVDTFNPVAKWFFYIFLIAEILNFLEAFLFYYTGWSPTSYRRPQPLRGRSVDVLIATYNEPVELLRETVVCALSMRYPHTTFILDDGGRPQVEELAREFGCRYIARGDRTDAKAGNLNNALRNTKGEFIVVLDADHVPAPELIDELLGFFVDPKVAIVQARQDFYNLDSFQHRLNRSRHYGWQQQDLFFSVIQAGKDRHNAAFYCGSPAILRRKALEEIGGFATGTITEDMHTSLRLQRRKWRTIYHNETVARGLAPQTFRGFSTQWYRWGYGAMQVLRQENPLFGSGFSFSQRLCYFASFYFYWMSYQKLLYVLTPVICLLSGIFPVVAQPSVFAIYFLPYLLLNVIASCMLQGGCRNFLLSEEFNLLKIQVLTRTVGGLFRKKIKFSVTPKARDEAASWRDVTLPLLIIAGLTVAVIYGGFQIAHQPAGFRFWAYAVNLFWAVFYLAMFIPSVSRALRREERRNSYRFPSSDLPVQFAYQTPTGQPQRGHAQAQNLNRSGLSLVTVAPIPVGTEVELGFRVDSQQILATGRVRRMQQSRIAGVSRVHHGVEFERINLADQDAISKYLFWHIAPKEDALLRLTPANRSAEPHEA